MRVGVGFFVNGLVVEAMVDMFLLGGLELCWWAHGVED